MDSTKLSAPARIAAIQQLLAAGEIRAAETHALALRNMFPDHAAGYALHARCAAERRDWPAAAERWALCLQQGSANRAVAHLGLGTALLNLGRHAQAAEAFAAARADNPDSEFALSGQARAVSRSAPALAEPLWRDLFARQAGAVPIKWRIERGNALAAAGDIDAALAAARELAAETDGHLPAAFALLARALTAGNRRDEAAQELQHGLMRDGGGAGELERMWLYFWIGDAPAAHICFTRALAAADNARAISALFYPLSRLYEGYAREQTWRSLRSRAAALLNPGDPQNVSLKLRIDLALRDHDSFLKRHAAAPPLPEPWAMRFRRTAAVLASPNYPDFNTPKVFGIGLSKTGTTSLGLALERLGYLHADFTNPFSLQLLDERDFMIFDSATDTPVSYRFETLYACYPNARFILTERPYDAWAASWWRHFGHRRPAGDFAELRRQYLSRSNLDNGLAGALVHQALYFRHAGLHEAYDAFHKRVERFFADKPADKLLRHNVFAGHGWPELCAFLGCDPPDESYPWANKAKSAEGHESPAGDPDSDRSSIAQAE